jgi:integrase
MHTYRHTFGTNLYRKGVPLKTASDLLGHSDISTTAKYYIGTRDEEKRKAIEMLSDLL